MISEKKELKKNEKYQEQQNYQRVMNTHDEKQSSLVPAQGETNVALAFTSGDDNSYAENAISADMPILGGQRHNICKVSNIRTFHSS